VFTATKESFDEIKSNSTIDTHSLTVLLVITDLLFAVANFGSLSGQKSNLFAIYYIMIFGHNHRALLQLTQIQAE
jgi:hypothetical protein